MDRRAFMNLGLMAPLGAVPISAVVPKKPLGYWMRAYDSNGRRLVDRLKKLCSEGEVYYSHSYGMGSNSLILWPWKVTYNEKYNTLEAVSRQFGAFFENDIILIVRKCDWKSEYDAVIFVMLDGMKAHPYYEEEGLMPILNKVKTGTTHDSAHCNKVKKEWYKCITKRCERKDNEWTHQHK